MKNTAESRKFAENRERRQPKTLAKRAAEDAVEDADLFAVLVRRQFEKSMPTKSHDSSVPLQTVRKCKVGAESDEEIDGVLIHPIEGTTRLVLSDELQEISLDAEVESIRSEPITLFHVQSRFPWVQKVLPGSA